jgi:hypothetical protein
MLIHQWHPQPTPSTSSSPTRPSPGAGCPILAGCASSRQGWDEHRSGRDLRHPILRSLRRAKDGAPALKFVVGWTKNEDGPHAMRIRSILFFSVIAVHPILGCRLEKPTSNGRVAGVFQFTSNYGRRHGTDLLVIESDNTYFHYYYPPVRAKSYTQSGKWRFFFDKVDGKEVVFDDFVPWGIEAWAGRGVTLDNTAQTRAGMKIDESGGVVRLEVDPDIGSYFAQLH